MECVEEGLRACPGTGCAEVTGKHVSGLTAGNVLPQSSVGR